MRMYIYQSGKYREVDPKGRIEVTPGKKDFSDQWLLLGAVERSKPFVMPASVTWVENEDGGIDEIGGPDMGREVKLYTLEELRTHEIEWSFKNGKQKVHIIDLDHGTKREWCCGDHSIILGGD